MTRSTGDTWCHTPGMGTAQEEQRGDARLTLRHSHGSLDTRLDAGWAGQAHMSVVGGNLVHRIPESPRLERTLKLLQSNH